MRTKDMNKSYQQKDINKKRDPEGPLQLFGYTRL